MKRVLCVLCLLSHLILSGQTIDDFNDNDLTVAPVWNVASNAFSNVLGVLKSSSTIANSQFALSTFAKIDSSCLWTVQIKLSFNPSSLNYIDVVLLSDSSNLLHMKNGFFVRLGGSTDDVSLFQTINGLDKKLIDGSDGLLNSSQSWLQLELLLTHDSMQLRHRNLKNGVFSIEGSAAVGQISNSVFVGFRIRQSTSSFFGKHQFDDLYIGPELKDTIAPQLKQCQVLNANTLKLLLNEPIDSVNAQLTQCSLSNHLATAQSRFVNDSIIQLVFADTMAVNSVLNLTLKGFSDLYGNAIDTAIEFKRYWFRRALKNDVVISEMMIDPEPSQGLAVKEYVEVYNHTADPILLNGWTINDPSVSLVLQSDTIMPKAYHVLSVHPSLNNSEDEIFLKHLSGELMDGVHYTDAWYQDANAQKGGFSLERVYLNQFCMGASNWRASQSNSGGTPNQVNSVSKFQMDSIGPQLMNYELSEQGVLTLYLTECIDSNQRLNMAVNKQDWPINSFKSLDNGLECRLPFLLKRDSVYHVCFSPIMDCQGNSGDSIALDLMLLSDPQPNAVVINEVLFNPYPNQVDFIELYNHSSKPIDLKRLFITNLTSDGLWDQIYPCATVNSQLPSNAYAVLCVDTLKLCAQYACHPKAMFIQLPKLPPMPDDASRLMLINGLSQTIDSIRYDQNWHFKWLANVEGISLERLSSQMQGTDANAWHSSSSLEGGASPGYENTQIQIETHSDHYFSVSSLALSPQQNDQTAICVIHYQLPETDAVISIDVYNIEGELVKSVLPATHIGVKGTIVWDGSDAFMQPCIPGVYIVLVQGVLPSGQPIKEKMCVVVSGQMAY